MTENLKVITEEKKTLLRLERKSQKQVHIPHQGLKETPQLNYTFNSNNN